MKRLILFWLLLFAPLFLESCGGNNILGLLKNATPEKKAEVAEKLLKHEQEQETKRQLNNMGFMFIIVMAAGIGLIVFGMKKIGESVAAGGLAALAVLWFWQTAQELVLKYPALTYAIGASIIGLSLIGMSYGLFEKRRGKK